WKPRGGDQFPSPSRGGPGWGWGPLPRRPIVLHAHSSLVTCHLSLVTCHSSLSDSSPHPPLSLPALKPARNQSGNIERERRILQTDAHRVLGGHRDQR